MQLGMFGAGEPTFAGGDARVRRRDLAGGAWVDWAPRWLDGHATLFEHLRHHTRWRQVRREMYDRMVDVPRLVASLPEDGDGHPLLARAAAALSARYGARLDRTSLALYRDGRDSVAFHGDRLGAMRSNALVAILSLGGPRRFLLRPVGGGPSVVHQLGWGDLLVMGGTCQETWEHAVPKARVADPRISVMFRHASPLEGGS